MLSRSRNALEMVRALRSILIVFLTENSALPISKRTRNRSNAKEYLNVSLAGNSILLIQSFGNDGDFEPPRPLAANSPRCEAMQIPQRRMSRILRSPEAANSPAGALPARPCDRLPTACPCLPILPQFHPRPVTCRPNYAILIL